MNRRRNFLALLCLAVFGLALCHHAVAQEALPEKPPDDVSGKWIVSSKGENGEVHTQYLTIEQNGTVIKGKFKGPYQSGSLNGTVTVHHIVFRTNTRHPLTYRGRINGNTIDGTIHIEGREGVFHAERQSP